MFLAASRVCSAVTLLCMKHSTEVQEAQVPQCYNHILLLGFSVGAIYT